MTLDEAIKHCEEKGCNNTECAKDHVQLAIWLKDYKTMKEEKGLLIKWLKGIHKFALTKQTVNGYLMESKDVLTEITVKIKDIIEYLTLENSDTTK